uniref:Uncharacterized protein n=1 Tax=Lepeophtheirus salmonis TaxID=72036 RepID=A0A0K2UMT0_LEPSM
MFSLKPRLSVLDPIPRLWCVNTKTRPKQ